MQDIRNQTTPAAQKGDRPFPQRMTAQVGGRTLGAAILASGDFAVVARCATPLCAEALRYAACRALAKSPALQRALLPACYRLRVGGRRAPKTLRRCLRLPAALFAVPRQAAAYLQVALTAEGACVERLWLLPVSERPPRPVNVAVVLAEQAPVSDPRPATPEAASA